MGVFDKFQEKVKICYQILAKNCQFLQNIYTWTANLGGSNFLVDIIQGTASAHKVIWKSDIYDKLKILVSAVVEKLCVKLSNSLKEQNGPNET